jgi:hypothetical protein
MDKDRIKKLRQLEPLDPRYFSVWSVVDEVDNEIGEVVGTAILCGDDLIAYGLTLADARAIVEVHNATPDLLLEAEAFESVERMRQDAERRAEMAASMHEKAKRDLEDAQKRMMPRLDEADRQMLLLALARLSIERPGWDHALNLLALQFDVPAETMKVDPKAGMSEKMTRDALEIHEKPRAVLYDAFRKIRSEEITDGRVLDTRPR